jgi:hypothetical protein
VGGIHLFIPTDHIVYYLINFSAPPVL